MQSNNTTRNLLPAKADLVVSLSLKSVNASSVFDDMLWIKHTIYTGIDDIWKNNIFTIENTASNGAVESSTPVDITQGLIEYLEEGEIEFLICNTSNTNDIVGRVVVPLSSFYNKPLAFQEVSTLAARRVMALLAKYQFLSFLNTIE